MFEQLSGFYFLRKYFANTVFKYFPSSNMKACAIKSSAKTNNLKRTKGINIDGQEKNLKPKNADCENMIRLRKLFKFRLVFSNYSENRN